MKLEINYRNKYGEKNVENKQHATKKPMVNEEIKEEIRKYIKTNEIGNRSFQSLWETSKREVYSATDLPHATKKISKKPELSSKGKRTHKVQSQQKEGNIKNQKGN